ncbi:Xaa-Pro dipeptidase [Bacillaceae bacterium]
MEQRLQRLRAALQAEKIDGLLVTNPFNRRYLSGFTGTAGVLLITRERALLLTDFRYLEQAAEQAPLFELREQKGKIAETIADVLPELGIARLGVEANHLTYGEFAKLQEACASAQLVPLADTVEKLRMKKDETEMAMIRKAAAIADQAFSHILGFIKPGVRELEIALELEFYMRKLGAKSSSFDIIVASGKRSALPHGVASAKKIERGDLVTLDFGAYYEGYCSDLTRTVAVGEPAAELRKIYEIVLRAQQNGVNRIRKGLSGKEADALTREIIQAAGYGDRFGHATGHGIGLEIHEGPTLSVRSETRLEPGMVVTVEPGIYLPGVGGVRIEDDVLITEEGREVLTASAKELIVL